MLSIHKALGPTHNTKEVKTRKLSVQVCLGQRLPAASVWWLPLFFSHAITRMTQLPWRAQDHTQLHGSAFLTSGTLYSEVHRSRFRWRKDCGPGEGPSPCKEQRQSYPQVRTVVAGVAQGCPAKNWWSWGLSLQ